MKSLAKKLRMVVVGGTRPEGIKLAPVIRALVADRRFHVDLCVTGQHRELMDQVLDLFDLQPSVDLDLMTPGQTLNSLSSAMIASLDGALQELDPDWVIVQGDTTSAAMAAIASFNLGIKVAHVEAGLRSGHSRDPFPEEANRRIVSTVADLHFAPTDQARRNLLSEGASPSKVHVTGNTVIDAVQWVAELNHATRIPEVTSGVRRILLTTHRRENHGDRLLEIIRAVNNLVDRYKGQVELCIPVHPNPNVSRIVRERLAGTPSVRLLEPLPYHELVALLNSSDLVLTDSGGLQEEAPGLGKPVLVLRETTERPEGIDAGVAKLVGTNSDDIFKSVTELLDDREKLFRMVTAASPYGDGKAGERIVDIFAALDVGK